MLLSEARHINKHHSNHPMQHYLVYQCSAKQMKNSMGCKLQGNYRSHVSNNKRINSQALSTIYVKICERNEITMIKNGSRGGP